MLHAVLICRNFCWYGQPRPPYGKFIPLFRMNEIWERRRQACCIKRSQEAVASMDMELERTWFLNLQMPRRPFGSVCNMPAPPLLPHRCALICLVTMRVRLSDGLVQRLRGGTSPVQPRYT